MGDGLPEATEQVSEVREIRGHRCSQYLQVRAQGDVFRGSDDAFDFILKPSLVGVAPKVENCLRVAWCRWRGRDARGML